MAKCKFYLRSPKGTDNKCLNLSCGLRKCWFTDPQNECECFEPIEENKEEFKDMKKCKSYSTHICKYYWNDSCHYSEKVFNGSPASCYYVNDFENCICSEPIERKLDFTGAKIVKLDIDEDRVMDTRTLTIQNCDKIILKPKSLEVEVKIEKDNFDDFDFIVVNGHKFKKV